MVKRSAGGSIERDFPNFILRLQKKTSMVPKQMYAKSSKFPYCWTWRICRFRESIVVAGAFLGQVCTRYELKTERYLLVVESLQE
jgi:hypothetical protein